jgi:hypothetical protein
MSIAPEGLPDAPIETSCSAMDKARFCPTCKVEARIVSNYLGINAFCPQCKENWPISATPMKLEIPIGPARGMSKVTLVEPDWNMALDSNYGSSNEQVGPRRKV